MESQSCEARSAKQDGGGDGDEEDLDAGHYGDADIAIPGGDVSQWDDGWRPAPGSSVAPVMQERARRRKDGIVVREVSTKGYIPEIRIPLLKAGDFKRLPME